MNRKTVGVVGIGEVGGAIAQIFSKNFKVLNRDLKFDEIKNSKIEVLHICIPYSENFERIVLRQIIKSEPKLVIIHSTTMPGTTEKIFKKSKTPIVHSPIIGTHPNLLKDILNFTKVIGPTNKESLRLSLAHFKSIGIKTEIFKSSLESEMAKLLDTTYYSWNIIFSKIVWEICQKSGVSFENVYTKFNKIYNSAYEKSKPNVRRPVLKYQKGKIGGHCLMPNAIILDKFISTELTRVLIKKNKQF